MAVQCRLIAEAQALEVFGVDMVDESEVLTPADEEEHIDKSSNPEKYAKAIVEATLHYDDPKLVAEVSRGLGEAMTGLDIKKLPKEELMQIRST